MPLWLSRLVYDVERALPGPVAYFNKKIASTALPQAVRFPGRQSAGPHHVFALGCQSLV